MKRRLGDRRYRPRFEIVGELWGTLADTTLARADLGYAPAVTLEAGLRAEWNWLREARFPAGIARGSGSV